MMLARVLLKALLRERATAGILIALTFLLCLPSIVPLQVFGLSNPAFAEMQKMNLELSRQNAAETQTVPEELAALDEERFRAMQAASATSSARDKWKAWAEADATLKRSAELGYSEWDADSEAYLRFYELAAGFDDVGTAANSTELPALHYASYTLSLVPFQVWLCISAWICWRVCKLMAPGSLLSRVPVREAGAHAAMLTTCILMSSLAFALPLALSFFPALLRNGLGSLLAPITFIANGEVIETSVAASLCGWAGMIVLQNCLVASLAAFVFGMTSNPAAALVAYVLHLVLSLSQVVSQASSLPGFKYVPWTYSDPARVFGCFGSWPNMVVAKFELFRGMPALLVALLWALALSVTGLVFAAVREGRESSHVDLA